MNLTTWLDTKKWINTKCILQCIILQLDQNMSCKAWEITFTVKIKNQYDEQCNINSARPRRSSGHRGRTVWRGQTCNRWQNRVWAERLKRGTSWTSLETFRPHLIRRRESAVSFNSNFCSGGLQDEGDLYENQPQKFNITRLGPLSLRHCGMYSRLYPSYITRPTSVTRVPG